MRRSFKSGERRRRGGVLVVALIAVTAVTAMGAVALQISVRTARQESQAVQHKQAFYLAEAGLAEAFTGLGIGKTGNVGSEAEPAVYGEGLFWVEADTVAGDLVRLKSTGMWGGGRATLALVAQGTVESVAALGLFSLDEIELEDEVLIDSFDSSIGDYASQVGTPSNFSALLGSNAGVSLESGEVRGDIASGGDVELGSASVSGSIQPLSQPATCPPVEIPAVGRLVDHTLVDEAPMVLPAGEHAYGLLDLGEGTTTLVQGPSTVVVDELVLRSGAMLELDSTDGVIEIFVAGSLDLQQGSTVVTPFEDPAGVVVQLAMPDDEQARLHSQGSFYGFLYSPDAAVDLGADFELFGGVVAQAFELGSGGALHYDLSIGAKLMTLPNRVSWRLVEIPSGVAAKGMDPFLLMGVDPAGLPRPADAHADQFIAVDYLDANGFAVTYAGLESGFDWSDVSAVVSLTRDGKSVVAPAEWLGVGTAAVAADGSTLSDEEQVMLDGLLDGSLASAVIAFLANLFKPVHPGILLAIAQATSTMQADDLASVIESHSPYDATLNPDGSPDAEPLSDDVLQAILAPGAPDLATLPELLIVNSPLSPAVLQAVVDRVPPLEMMDLFAVMAAQ
ncbi:MAG: hypothetical protein AAF682_10085 [Planctomycetota bacterium]